MPVTTDFAGTETLAETKSRLGTLLTAYGYDSSGYSTWGDARTDLNSALTAIEETTISDGELASSFRSKLNALNAWSDYPAGGKVPNLVFDFEDEYYRANDTETTFGDSITFSRASSATYVDSDGVLQTAASGVPRIGHHVWNGSAWVNEGLLHESEARTNLFTNSGDMDGTGWAGFRTTYSDGDTAPDGSQLFLLGTASETNSNGSNIAQQAKTLAAGTYTMSVFAKAGPSDPGLLAFRPSDNADFTDGVQAWFDLETGIVTSNSVSGSSLITAPIASMESWGGGVYRCSLTFTVTGSVSCVTRHYISDATGTLAVTIGKQAQVWGAQLELGPTPSSYIPTTSGSTVTREAETLTIPAAKLPWPTPNVIGPELVTNGTFDTDVSGWTAIGGSISWVSGSLRLTEDGSDGVSARAYQSITTEVGKVYRITVDVGAVSDGNAIIAASDNTNFGGKPQITASANTSAELIFVAVATSTYVLLTASGTSARTLDFDNVSVREIDPLSVSIQMDGRMTYADTDNVNEVMFLRWFSDVQNRIQTFINTSSGVNPLVFFQEALNVDDNVSLDNAYSPGVLVPYNIASRHGSTFVNGAVDGTEIGVDTTPVALPDLSTTDLSLGYEYMGTIRTFRVWNQDLGDSGIEEASA